MAKGFAQQGMLELYFFFICVSTSFLMYHHLYSTQKADLIYTFTCHIYSSDHFITVINLIIIDRFCVSNLSDFFHSSRQLFILLL
jgi:hypothetical protein